MEQEHELEINGFSFRTAEEAEKAKMELRKIQYLESKIDYADTRKVQAIFEKAVREKVFHTPVGLFYLKGIRDYLTREDERYEAILPCVPVMSIMDDSGKNETKEEQGAKEGQGAKTRTAARKREETQKKELRQKNQGLVISVLANVVLAVAVLVMLWIAVNTEQPNILNYEKAIMNRYSAWDQELTQREQLVREKELELFREE